MGSARVQGRQELHALPPLQVEAELRKSRPDALGAAVRARARAARPHLFLTGSAGHQLDAPAGSNSLLECLRTAEASLEPSGSVKKPARGYAAVGPPILHVGTALFTADGP